MKMREYAMQFRRLTAECETALAVGKSLPKVCGSVMHFKVASMRKGDCVGRALASCTHNNTNIPKKHQ